MIKVENGVVMMCGTAHGLMSELTGIIRGMLEKGVLDSDSLQLVIDVAKMSDSELDEYLSNASEEAMKMALSKLVNMFGEKDASDIINALIKEGDRQ